MRFMRLLACAVIAGFASGAAHAEADVIGAGGMRILNAQYGDGSYDGGHGGQAGPGWRGGWPGGWYGRPGWYGDPPGQPRSWPSQWGGGWYGGWYQPYWGQGAWASPNWVYGSEHYYGHYPAPSACGPNGCGQSEYAPLK